MDLTFRLKLIQEVATTTLEIAYFMPPTRTQNNKTQRDTKESWT